METSKTINKRRLVVKKGAEYFTLSVENLAYAYVDNKIVYIVDKNGMKYIYDKYLYELYDELDKIQFFRANRKYILNYDSIKSFKTYERVKIQVTLKLENNEVIIISQDNAAEFKQWVSQY